MPVSVLLVPSWQWTPVAALQNTLTFRSLEEYLRFECVIVSFCKLCEYHINIFLIFLGPWIIGCQWYSRIQLQLTLSPDTGFFSSSTLANRFSVYFDLFLDRKSKISWIIFKWELCAYFASKGWEKEDPSPMCLEGHEFCDPLFFRSRGSRSRSVHNFQNEQVGKKS